MFQSPILDVAVGIVLVYIVLAFVCSSLNEYLAQVLQLRTRNLWSTISGLFGSDAEGTKFATDLYNHPLIQALAPSGPDAKPSFIPAHLFSLALVDQLGLNSQTAPAIHVSAPANEQSELSALVTAAALAPVVTAAAPTIATSEIAADQTISTRIVGLSLNDSTTKLLQCLAANADGDVVKFRDNVEAWFNAAMDRASAWYKAQVQLIIFVIAMVVTAACNADTISIANTLWTNPVAREKQVVAAQQAVKSPTPNQNAKPAGTTGPAINTTHVAPDPTADAAKAGAAPTLALLGWSGQTLPEGFEWFSKLFGLFLTALAASLGAPFWFDLLNKLVSLRNVVSPSTPPAKSTNPSDSKTKAS